MSYVKSRKHAVARSVGPITGMAAMTMLSLASSTAVAQNGQGAMPGASALGEVTVRDSAERFKTDVVSSPKYTAPLRDTPQSITVIPAKVLEQQNSLSLEEALTSNVPGITFQSGEGGGGSVDSIMLRGYSASDNITQDGAADAGQYSRTDFFNMESIEVTSGASSVYGGAGNVSGGINLLSKTPKAEDFTRLGVGLGTSKYGRATVDMNRRASDSVAWRLNAMVHRNDVAERDVEFFKRWGIAPSVTFGMQTPTRVTLSYFYQKDDYIQQYGVPYANTPFNNGPIPGIARNNYYQYRNIGNGAEIDNHRLSALVEHRFDTNLRLRNFTRFGMTDSWEQIDTPRGTWCVGGVNPYALTAADRACTIPDNTFLPDGGPHGYSRTNKNRIISNQTDLIAKAETGSLKHDIVVGLQLSQESYSREAGGVLNDAAGKPIPGADRTPMSATNPQGIWNGPPPNYVKSRWGENELRTIAAYAFDNIRFNEQWSLNTGLRLERLSGETLSHRIRNGVDTDGVRYKTGETLFSYLLGGVYKPTENGSVYLSFSNAKTPVQASVRLSCRDRDCNVDPETAVNYELGTKWDLLDQRLAVTAALFRNERKNYRVRSGDPLQPEDTLDGKSRVDGLSLGVAGQITPAWGVFANYTFLDSEVVQGVSDHVRRTTGIDASAGNPLTQTPKHAANFWTAYDFGHGWSAGYGFNYTGSYYLNNDEAPLYKAPGHVLHNAMVSYALNRNLSFQLNAKNLTNKEYYTRIRSRSSSRFAVPGTGRTVTLNAVYSF